MPSEVRRLRLQHCAPCFSHKNPARRSSLERVQRPGEGRPCPAPARPVLPAPCPPPGSSPAPHLGGQLALTRHGGGRAAALIGTGGGFCRVVQSVSETAAPRRSKSVCAAAPPAGQERSRLRSGACSCTASAASRLAAARPAQGSPGHAGEASFLGSLKALPPKCCCEHKGDLRGDSETQTGW